MKTIYKQKAISSRIDRWKKPAKYTVVKNTLEEKILQMAPGDKILPMRDLMKNLKVSQITLDRALRELETKNLVTRRWGNGIYVSKKEARKKTHMVGVMVSDITDRFCALLVRGIERKLSEENYRVIFCNGYKEFKNELRVTHSLREKIDGAIINPMTDNIHNPEYVKYFANLERSKEFPFLLIDIAIPGVKAHFVGFDHFKSFYEATKIILKEKDERPLVYVGSWESFPAIERWHGFNKGLRELNIREEKVKIINVNLSSLELDILWQPSGSKKPVIFFIASPLILPKFINYIQGKQIKIPEEALIISVVEEDYKDYIHLPIIALVKPSLKLGEETARIMKNIIEEKPVQEITKFDLKIEIPEILFSAKRG